MCWDDCLDPGALIVSAALRLRDEHRGDAEVKKTQLGPGSTHGNRLRGSCGEMGNRPACRSVRDRPGESDATLRRHRRTACVEAATQPRDGCAAGTWNSRGCGTHSGQGSPYSLRSVPTSEPASGEQCSTPRTAHAAGRRLSLVKRRRESRARSVRPLRVGDGPSRFLGGKRWKKPETDSIITPADERREGPDPTLRPTQHKSLAPFVPALRCDVAPAVTPAPRTAPAYFRQIPQVRMRRTHRRKSARLRSTRAQLMVPMRCLTSSRRHSSFKG